MSKKNKLSTRRNHHQALLQRELHIPCIILPSLACSCMRTVRLRCDKTLCDVPSAVTAGEKSEQADKLRKVEKKKQKLPQGKVTKQKKRGIRIRKGVRVQVRDMKISVLWCRYTALPSRRLLPLA